MSPELVSGTAKRWRAAFPPHSATAFTSSGYNEHRTLA